MPLIRVGRDIGAGLTAHGSRTWSLGVSLGRKAQGRRRGGHQRWVTSWLFQFSVLARRHMHASLTLFKNDRLYVSLATFSFLLCCLLPGQWAVLLGLLSCPCTNPALPCSRSPDST